MIKPRKAVFGNQWQMMVYGVAKVVMTENHQQNGLRVLTEAGGQVLESQGWFLLKAVKKDVPSHCLWLAGQFTVVAGRGCLFIPASRLA